MAVKNNIDVFYFSVLIPLNVFFVEDGKMGKKICPGPYFVGDMTHIEYWSQAEMKQDGLLAPKEQ